MSTLKGSETMTKQKRTIALLLAAALCFAMLFSAFFIGMEAHHDCTGADCVICDCIHTCENILKTSAAAIMLLISLLVCISAFFYVQEAISSCTGLVTLISLKVKLSN